MDNNNRNVSCASDHFLYLWIPVHVEGCSQVGAENAETHAIHVSLKHPHTVYSMSHVGFRECPGQKTEPHC